MGRLYVVKTPNFYLMMYGVSVTPNKISRTVLRRNCQVDSKVCKFTASKLAKAILKKIGRCKHWFQDVSCYNKQDSWHGDRQIYPWNIRESWNRQPIHSWFSTRVKKIQWERGNLQLMLFTSEHPNTNNELQPLPLSCLDILRCIQDLQERAQAIKFLSGNIGGSLWHWGRQSFHRNVKWCRGLFQNVRFLFLKR